MRRKILGVLVCMLLIVTTITIVRSTKNNAPCSIIQKNNGIIQLNSNIEKFSDWNWSYHTYGFIRNLNDNGSHISFDCILVLYIAYTPYGEFAEIGLSPFVWKTWHIDYKSITGYISEHFIWAVITGYWNSPE